MAVFDTEENDRTKYTKETLDCLKDTVDWSKHRIIVIDNNSCIATKKLLSQVTEVGKVITLSENIGTAGAINFGIKQRLPGDNVIKIDNDVVINQSGWVDEMEEAISRDPSIGIIGLKRKDVDFDKKDAGYELISLPHIAGQSWITVEKGWSIMGTCTMYNSSLIDKIGLLFQPGKYGFDDSIYSLRSTLAGFWNCYLPHINIDHIDSGSNPYTQEKHAQASAVWNEYHQLHAGYISGKIPLYYDGGFDIES